MSLETISTPSPQVSANILLSGVFFFFFAVQAVSFRIHRGISVILDLAWHLSIKEQI